MRRVSGTDRFDTAAQLALDAFPDGADTVYVATGLAFADALSGVPAAARFDAPLLLVASASIPQATRDALEELGPSEVVILGGTGAIGQAVENELRDLAGETTRREGASRFETAVEVARTTFLGARTVYVATGVNFPDALGGGPAAARVVGPLLLTPGASLPAAVASELVSLNPRRVVVLGGQAAVRDAVLEQIRAALEGATSLPDGTVPELGFTAARGAPDGGAIQSVFIGTTDGALEEFSNPVSAVFDSEADFSPDGRRIAFVRTQRDDPHSGEIYVGNVADGVASVRQISDNANDFDGGCAVPQFSWSTESNQVAFVCLRAQPDPDPDDSDPSAFFTTSRYTQDEDDVRARRVVVVGVDGSRTIVDPGASENEDDHPVFHPDGEHLTLERFVASPGEGEDNVQLRNIPLENLASEGELLYSRNGGLLSDFHWSDDGETLYFVESAFSLTRWISILEVGEDEPTRILDDEDSGSPTARDRHILDGVDPAGDHVLVRTEFVTDPDDEDASPQDIVRLVPIADPEDQTVLVGFGDLASSRILQSRLSPDGTQVLYDDITSAGFDGRIMLVDADGSNRREIEAGDVSAGQPVWNPAAFE